MELPEELNNEIWEYCRVNEITNMDEFKTKLVQQGFTIEKFGSAPAGFEIKPKTIEKILEVIKEIEVEKIVEVIREVEVEKKIYITDEEANKELQEEIGRVKGVHDSNVTDMKLMGVELNELKGKHSALIEKHEQELKDLEEKYKAEGKKPDIYGGATFGSNLRD